MKTPILQFEHRIDTVHDLLVAGIRRFFASAKATKATLGLSGGLDSAVVLALAVEVLGAENIRVLLMPSEYSTEHSVADAVQLADTLGVQRDTIEIKPLCREFDNALSHIFESCSFDVTEENIQARIRGTLLMALSNKFGHLLLNTSNKSELAVGYGTLYGDLCGALSVIGDIYKTQVYELAEYINRNGEIIPYNTIQKPPSAELRHGQKDSDSLPDYKELDAILFQLIEKGQAAEMLIAEGHDANLVNKILRMTGTNKFKALQVPPIVKISSKPLVAEYKWV